MKRLLVLVALAIAELCAAQVTVTPIVQPHQTLFDGSGAACSLCKLYSYVAGTTTPQPTYTDSTGTSQNTNPITLDVAGGANVWVASALSYKFVLKDASGSTLWTVDNVKSTGGTINPATGIDWSQITGAGAPTAVCPSSTNTSTTATVGRPYTDITNNIQYNCGSHGWFVSRPVLTDRQSIHTFGDSITFGNNASPLSNSFVNRFAASLNLPPNNSAVPGSFAADQLDAIYATSVSSTASQLFTYMIGMNDKSASTGQQWYSTDGLVIQDSLAWLATPNHLTIQQAIANGSCTTTGTWTTAKYANTGAVVYGGIGLQSSQVGATLTCGNFSGTVLYLGALMQENGSQGTYAVTLDGGAPVTYSTWGFGNNFQTSILGRAYGDQLIRVPANASINNHSVTVTIVDGTVPTAIEWVGSNADQEFSAGPLVLAAGPTTNGTGDANYLTDNPKNVIFQQIVKYAANLLQGDGLPIRYVNTFDYMDPQLRDISSDGTHPFGNGTNGVTDGHYHIFQAFLNSLTNGSAALPQNEVAAYSIYPSTLTSPGIINRFNGGSNQASIQAIGSLAPATGSYLVPTLDIFQCQIGASCSTPTIHLDVSRNLVINGKTFFSVAGAALLDASAHTVTLDAPSTSAGTSTIHFPSLTDTVAIIGHDNGWTEGQNGKYWTANSANGDVHTSTAVIDYSAGARFLAYGPDNATPGNMLLQGKSSNGSVAYDYMSCQYNSVCNFPHGISVPPSSPPSGAVACIANSSWDDDNYHYHCVAAGTSIKRVALAAF